MDRRLVHVRLYDPKRNPRSCEQLPPALRLRCEHHVALAQTLDETAAFSTIIESSHVHLFDAKCVAPLSSLPQRSGCCRPLSGSAGTWKETVGWVGHKERRRRLPRFPLIILCV